MATAYGPLIADVARSYGLNARQLEAQVIVESSGYTDAFRYEREFYERYLKGKPEWADWNPRRCSSSYGLLQIMFPVARELGFTREPEFLFVPSIGLDWGAKYLRSLIDWAHGDIERALAAYNGGRGAAMTKPYRTQSYVDDVLKMERQLEMNA